MNRVAVADLLAINDLIGRWGHWKERREEVQARRARPDSQILPMFLHPLWRIESDPGYVDLQEGLEEFLGLDDLFAGMTTLEDPPA